MAGARVFGTGTKRVAIPPRVHDFVIPSVSQAMHLFDDPQGPRPPKFLGNTLNPKGTHISGGDETDSDSDSSVVRSMLDAGRVPGDVENENGAFFRLGNHQPVAGQGDD